MNTGMIHKLSLQQNIHINKEYLVYFVMKNESISVIIKKIVCMFWKKP